MADEIEKESNIKNALGYDSVDEMIKEKADKKWDEIKKKNKEQLKKVQNCKNKLRFYNLNIKMILKN